MAKQRPDKADKQAAKVKPPPAPKPAGPWSFWLRLLASVAVAWHLFAVFISPFSVPPSSPLVRFLATSPYVRWYSDPMYINGGYHFFGPDPPLAGLLVRYEVTDGQGEVVVSGEFPNRANDNYAKQWPRLWYHRHMMLADQTGEALVNRNQDGTPNREANLRLTLRSYARHLLRKHGGDTARLEYVEHLSLNPDQARAGVDPTSPELYRTLTAVTETADRLGELLLPSYGQPAVLESLPPGPGSPSP